MPQKLPENAEQLVTRGISALNGVLEGFISPEEGAAVADLISTSLRLAKLEIDLQQPAANTSD